jgi:hypothetical protein
MQRIEDINLKFDLAVIIIYNYFMAIKTWIRGFNYIESKLK